jgi:hypothetical protein
MCRYVRPDSQQRTSFWRVVLYCDADRRSPGMTRSQARASVHSPSGTATDEHAWQNVIGPPVTGDPARSPPTGERADRGVVPVLLLGLTSIVETVPLL